MSIITIGAAVIIGISFVATVAGMAAVWKAGRFEL